MAWFGPGSGTAPAGYQAPTRQSRFVRPGEGTLPGARVANIAGLGMFELGTPDDPLTQMVGRLPGEAPQEWMANQFLNSLYGNATYTPGGGGYNGPTGIGGAGMTGAIGFGNNAPYGPTTNAQLDALRAGSADPETLAANARKLAFQEFERIPGLYEGDLAQETQAAIRRQLSGEDAPFTPNVVNQLRSRIGSQAAAENTARERMIGDQAAGRGLGGGGMELGLRLASREQAAQQRAREGSNLDVTSSLENFASRERGRQAGAGFVGQQARDMTPSILAKGNLLGRYEVTGQSPFDGLFGQGYNPGWNMGGSGYSGGVASFGGAFNPFSYTQQQDNSTSGMNYATGRSAQLPDRQPYNSWGGAGTVRPYQPVSSGNYGFNQWINAMTGGYLPQNRIQQLAPGFGTVLR